MEKNLIHFTTKEGLNHDTVRSIIEDSKGILWVGTDNGVCSFDGKSFTQFTQEAGVKGDIIMALEEDSKGNLWIGSFDGVSKFDGKEFVHITSQEGLSYPRINDIIEDKDGNLWFSTEGKGVNKYDGNSITYYTAEEGLSHDRTKSLFEDGKGNIWISTYGGLNILRESGFTNMSNLKKNGENSVWSVMRDSKGYLWIATYGDGVKRFDGQKLETFTSDEGLSSSLSVCTYEDREGNIWIGTWGGGMCKFDGKYFTHFAEAEGLSYDLIKTFCEDKNGHLWIATWQGGVTKYDGETFIHYTEKEGFSSNIVRTIIRDKDDNLWFGTRGGGLTKYNGETFINYTTKEGLGGNIIETIYEDENGILWLGVEGSGVCRFDGKTFIHYLQDRAVSENIISAIIGDGRGNIWVSTEKKLIQMVFKKDSTNNKVNDEKILSHVVQYAKHDGLIAAAYNANSALYEPERGLMWWGTSKGLTQLDLKSFDYEGLVPKTHLNRIEINGENLAFSSLSSESKGIYYSEIEPFYNYPKNLVLEHQNNHLTFHFTASEWTAPHKLVYSYSLEGFNDEWSEPTHEIKVDYRNLPHGTYTFKVKAKGLSDTWSSPAAYTFTIKAAWWNTLVARIVYVFLLLALIYVIIKSRIKFLEAQKREMEEIIQVRTKELHQKNQEISSQNEELNKQAKELNEKNTALEAQSEEIISVNEELTQKSSQLEEINKTLECQKIELIQAMDDLKNVQIQLIQSEKMASLGQLTAGVAHEINNPVNFISVGVNVLEKKMKNFTQIVEQYESLSLDTDLITFFDELEQLQKKWKYKDSKEKINIMLKDIKMGVERTQEIVKGLQSFSRVNEAEEKVVSLHESLDSALILLRNKMVGKVELVRRYDPEIKGIACYPGQLNQVFMNLISNAVDAIEEQGEIIITTRKSEKAIIVEISDSGSGIPKDVQDRIFEPFFTTKEIGKGTGLGLSISFQIIEKHKGTIRVESELGKGTTFIITLPDN